MLVTVDKKLLPMKAHYFLFNAGTAPVVPFMTTFARQLGFSSVVVGTIYTILPIVGMLAKPLFGIIADKFQRRKLLFLIFQILTAVAFFCIMFIPSIPQKPQVEFHCNSGISDVRFCPKSNKLDDCIKHNLEERYQNTTVPCQLKCKNEPWISDVINKNWNIKSPKTTPYFEFDINLRMEHIYVEGECLFFLLNHAVIYNQNKTMICPSTINRTECDITCSENYVTDLMTEVKIQNSDVIWLYQFWLLFIFLIISWAGMAVVVSVGDAICFEMLGDRHDLYGHQRLWGAVGWGVFSVIAGILVDEISGGSVIKDYTIVFYMTAVLIGLDMFASSKLQHKQTKLSTNILKDVGKIFLSVPVIIFFMWCITVGLCTALIWNFLFWHLEVLGSSLQGCDDQNWMKTLQGIVMGIQCFGGELPFFFLSGWILKKIGHVNAMSLVLFGFGIRFLLYSILEDPWWVLPIELLNGITFGIFYPTMASYASIVAPPGTEATLQGLVGAIFEGIGVSIGSLIGGILIDLIGGSATFKYFGIYALCAFCLHTIVQWLLPKFCKNNGMPSEYLTPGDAIHMLNDQEYQSVA